MNTSGFKSATTAGLLGIFLGAVGAHNWYLGDKKKGTQHVIIFGAGAAVMLVTGVILPSVMSFWTLYRMAWLLTILDIVAWLAIGASEVWGFIEGIQILTQGDAGLAQRGYRVAPNAMQNFGGQYGGQTNQMGNQVNQNQGQNMGNSNMNGGQNNGQ